MNKYQIADQIEETQHTFKKLEIDLSRYTTDMNPRIRYEFEEIGIAMDKWFGKKCWFIFYRPEASLRKVKEAFKICQDKGIRKLEYLIGIIK